MKKEEVEYVTLARIVRPWGNKGEVAADNLEGGLRYFAPGTRLQVFLPNHAVVELELTRAREHKGRVILGFVGIGTISDAERLQGAEVRCEKRALATLPDGEYYLDDLIGCNMVDAATGRQIGTVHDVYEPPGGVLLFSVLAGRDRELLVPFATEICREVDLDAQRILVELPEGMEELQG